MMLSSNIDPCHLVTFACHTFCHADSNFKLVVLRVLCTMHKYSMNPNKKNVQCKVPLDSSMKLFVVFISYHTSDCIKAFL